MNKELEHQKKGNRIAIMISLLLIALIIIMFKLT